MVRNYNSPAKPENRESEFSYACVVSVTGRGVNVVFFLCAQEFPPGCILPVLSLGNLTL